MPSVDNVEDALISWYKGKKAGQDIALISRGNDSSVSRKEGSTKELVVDQKLGVRGQK